MICKGVEWAGCYSGPGAEVGNSRGQPLGVWGPTQTPTCTTPAPIHPRVRVIPTGVGVLTLCGFTPGWGTYSLVHKYIGKNIVLLFTIYNEITTFMWALPASCRCHHHHHHPAVVNVFVVLAWTCWRHCCCHLHHTGAGVGVGVGAGEGAGGVLDGIVAVVLQGQGKVQAALLMALSPSSCRGRAR